MVVVVAGCRTTHSVRATFLTRLARTFALGRAFTVLAFALLTIAGRAGGFSATWTAPPPMIAPPQVQAQSFAKAILTDIRRTLFEASIQPWKSLPDIRKLHRAMPTDAKDSFQRKHVNHDDARKCPANGRSRRFRANRGQSGGTGERKAPHLPGYIMVNVVKPFRFGPVEPSGVAMTAVARICRGSEPIT